MEEDAQLIPAGMSNDCIAQTWYRFLRTIGSPIALCSPQIISKTPQFMQWVVSRAAEGVEAINHPCLLQLPLNFLKAIKGISSQVDAFLGMEHPHRTLSFRTVFTSHQLRNKSLLFSGIMYNKWFFFLLFLKIFSKNTHTFKKWHLLMHWNAKYYQLYIQNVNNTLHTQHAHARMHNTNLFTHTHYTMGVWID